jgi:predicted nucleotide-binding protein
VFLVHGKNHHVRDQIDLYLTKELGLHTCVMEAGAYSGRTLPEKLEEMASDCTFAVFILTGDDVLKDAKNASLKRARQNVILEVGYFWGALGRRDRVAFLVEDDPAMDLPSDIHGIGWIPITSDLGDTKLKLHSELRAAGLLP